MGGLSAGTRVPVWAVIVQAVWSSVLAVSGTFDQLTDCLLFASWIFYGLVTSSVFVLRRKMPEAARPYRTLGYPLVPLVFVLVSAWLVVNTLIEKRVESVTGLVLILIGLPLYFYFRRARRRPRPPPRGRRRGWETAVEGSVGIAAASSPDSNGATRERRREIARAHGGEARCLPREGGGTVFEVVLGA